MTLASLAIVVIGNVALAQDMRPPKQGVPERKAEYSPFVDDHFPNRVLFDDTHLHTAMSTDAGMIGQERAYTSPIWYTP